MAYVFGPTWFYGIDYIFDFVSVIVGLLISYFSYKTYRYTSQKKYFYFSASFFLVALAFIAKILATIPIYSKELKVETLGLVTVTSQIINKVTWINALGISIARLVMLFAFLILVIVSLKIKDKKIIALLIYFLVISTTLVSASYIVFHVTLLIMLAILFLSYRKNYLRVKSLNAKMVMYSFFMLFLSQIFFVFEGVRYVEYPFFALLISQIFFVFGGLVKNFYVIGESIQVVGYLILLVAIIKMLIKK